MLQPWCNFILTYESHNIPSEVTPPTTGKDVLINSSCSASLLLFQSVYSSPPEAPPVPEIISSLLQEADDCTEEDCTLGGDKGARVFPVPTLRLINSKTTRSKLLRICLILANS